MYLSKAFLNPRDSQVFYDLGNVYELHRTLSNAFPEKTKSKSFREEFQILYRIEYIEEQLYPFLLMQSNIIPMWEQILAKHPNYFNQAPKSKELSPLINRLKENQRCIFKLKANPVKRPPPKKYEKGEYRGKTNRIPITNEEQLMTWLNKKSKSAGFKLVRVNTENEHDIPDIRTRQFSKSKIETPYRYRKKTGHTLTFSGVIFEGHLRITDLAKFKKALVTGIGPGKAFGFGLLSIYPVIN
jgi:CRISPR system Cascade subunit CasE